MGGRWLGRALSAVRQGLSVGAEFGPRALEALVSLAETVEGSVYEPGSLVLGPAGLRFVLLNPPLRVGAFTAMRVAVDGRPADAATVQFRVGSGLPWRSVSAVSPVAPLELRPGERTEVRTAVVPPGPDARVRVRLELENIAIPPLVWFEFEAVPRPGVP